MRSAIGFLNLPQRGVLFIEKFKIESLGSIGAPYILYRIQNLFLATESLVGMCLDLLTLTQLG